MTMPDRVTFARGLGAALAAPEPAQGVNDFLRAVLTTEPVVWESAEQRLMRSITERIDVASGDAARLVRLARNVQALLEAASSNEVVELLLELVAERERVHDIFRKYANGTITRTGFLSFIAEQRWPENLRRHIAALSAKDTEAVVHALDEGDIERLEALIAA